MVAPVQAHSHAISASHYCHFRNTRMWIGFFISKAMNSTVHPIEVAQRPVSQTEPTTPFKPKGTLMNRFQATIVAAAFSTVFTSLAFAGEASPGLTREQVQAELGEAIRTGHVFDAATNQLAKDAYPALYTQAARAQAVATPAKHASAKAEQAPAVKTAAPQGKTREQVINELAEAIRTGDVLDTATGLQMKEAYPQLYPQAATAQAQAKPVEAAATQTAGLRR
jgi:Domain of unknown function (DUF4148)